MQSSQCPKFACLKSYVALAFVENPFLNPPVSELGAFEFCASETTLSHFEITFFYDGDGIGGNTSPPLSRSIRTNHPDGLMDFFRRLIFATFWGAIVTPLAAKTSTR